MDITAYPTHQTGNQEFSFHSVGPAGVIELRMRITLIDAETRFYNIGFGVWDMLKRDIDDRATIRNGDTDRILATIGQKALEFLQRLNISPRQKRKKHG